MLAFGDARVEFLMQDLDGRSQDYLSCLCRLLGARGYPVGEDKIFTPALEFWSTFTETMADSMYSGDGESLPWVRVAMAHVMQAVSNAWRKVAFPPPEEFGQWDSSERAGFSDARKDLADFLQSAYTVVGSRLILTFSEVMLQALQSHSWAELEAATFCLGSLADCIIGDPSSDPTLNSVFSSSLFDLLRQPGQGAPGRVRQACVALIERYSDYFERNPESLPPALNLLFAVVGDGVLTSQASKSIYRLCSSSRSSLSMEIDIFLSQYGSLSELQLLDCQASERMVGAMASIAQAIKNRPRMLQVTRRLLEFVRRDARGALELLALATSGTRGGGLSGSNEHRCPSLISESELPHHIAVKALRCLVSMGKAFQAPVEGPVDLDAADNLGSRTGEAELAAMQGDILDMVLRLHVAFPGSGEVVDTACNIFRSGFSESEIGPFVFPPVVVADYLMQHNAGSPRIGAVVGTACSFASSVRRCTDSDVDVILSRILVWIIGLLQDPCKFPHIQTHIWPVINAALGSRSDTELSQNAIEFVSRIVSRNASLLLELEHPRSLEFFVFTFDVLDGREPLPKASAADFWVIHESSQSRKEKRLTIAQASFISLQSGKASTQVAIDEAMMQLGPTFCEALVRNIGGNASRSELDKLAEPLKKLASRQVMAQGWLNAALHHPSFPSMRVSEEEKSMFLKKVIR